MAETKKKAAAKPVASIKTAAADAKKVEAKVETTVKAAEKKVEEKAVEKVVEKAVEKKAAPAKKTVAKKAVEKTEEKVVEKKAAEKKAAPAKKAAAPKEEEVKANIVLQYAGKNVTYDTIVQVSKDSYQNEMGGNVDEIKKLSVYVKPEENAAYYVVNDKVQGRVEI